VTSRFSEEAHVSRFVFVLGSALVALSLSACGSSRDESARAESQAVLEGDSGANDAATTDAATSVVTVLVQRASFSPVEVTLPVGGTVRWVWERGRHNVVSGNVVDGEGIADGKFCNAGGATCDEAPLQGPPYTYEHTFAAAGDYPYFCTPHVPMGMVGTIHVVP
jgi:plastocyanin